MTKIYKISFRKCLKRTIRNSFEIMLNFLISHETKSNILKYCKKIKKSEKEQRICTVTQKEFKTYHFYNILILGGSGMRTKFEHLFIVFYLALEFLSRKEKLFLGRVIHHDRFQKEPGGVENYDIIKDFLGIYFKIWNSSFSIDGKKYYLELIWAIWTHGWRFVDCYKIADIFGWFIYIALHFIQRAIGYGSKSIQQERPRNISS